MILTCKNCLKSGIDFTTLHTNKVPDDSARFRLYYWLYNFCLCDNFTDNSPGYFFLNHYDDRFTLIVQYN